MESMTTSFSVGCPGPSNRFIFYRGPPEHSTKQPASVKSSKRPSLPAQELRYLSRNLDSDGQKLSGDNSCSPVASANANYGDDGSQDGDMSLWSSEFPNNLLLDLREDDVFGPSCHLRAAPCETICTDEHVHPAPFLADNPSRKCSDQVRESSKPGDPANGGLADPLTLHQCFLSPVIEMLSGPSESARQAILGLQTPAATASDMYNYQARLLGSAYVDRPGDSGASSLVPRRLSEATHNTVDSPGLFDTLEAPLSAPATAGSQSTRQYSSKGHSPNFYVVPPSTAAVRENGHRYQASEAAPSPQLDTEAPFADCDELRNDALDISADEIPLLDQPDIPGPTERGAVVQEVSDSSHNQLTSETNNYVLEDDDDDDDDVPRVPRRRARSSRKYSDTEDEKSVKQRRRRACSERLGKNVLDNSESQQTCSASSSTSDFRQSPEPPAACSLFDQDPASCNQQETVAMVSEEEDEENGYRHVCPRDRKRRQQRSKSQSSSHALPGDKACAPHPRHTTMNTSRGPAAAPPGGSKQRDGRMAHPTLQGVQSEPTISLSTLQQKDQPTWRVDRIVSSARRRGKLLYRVRWMDTWEPAESLQGCADLAVAEFHLKD